MPLEPMTPQARLGHGRRAGRLLFLPFLSLLVCALATPAAAVLDAPLPPPSELPLPDWLVPGPTQPSAGLAAAWEGVTRVAMPYLDATPSAAEMATRSWQGPAALPAFIELHVTEGEYAGMWRFHAREGQAQPQAAWRLRLSEAPPYRVNAQLLCDDAAGGCLALQRELAQIQPPRPSSEATMADWLRIIADGPCEPGPVHMPAPHYPHRALRNDAGGNVRVLIAFNACGEVRHASVYESSRSRDLDSAAVQAARGWRIAPPADSTGPGQAVVTVRFDIEDAGG